MKYTNICKSRVKYNDPEAKRKLSKLWKWTKRITFLILLLLLLLKLQHYNVAIEALEKTNLDQMITTNELLHRVNVLQGTNDNLQAQVHYLNIKINGMELHNQSAPNSIPHTETKMNTLHNISKINNVVTPVGIATATAITIYTFLKHIVSFASPVMP